MLGPFEFLLLSSACCAVTRELTLGRRTWDSHDRTASLWAEARGVVHVNEAGIQGQGLALRVIAQEEWKQPLLENFRKTRPRVSGEVSEILFIHKSSWGTFRSVLPFPKGNGVLKSYSSARLYFFLLLGCISKVITFGLLASNNLWLQRIMTS